jgi:hypothetical protein
MYWKPEKVVAIQCGFLGDQRTTQKQREKNVAKKGGEKAL